jgi:hypothetical protein
MSSHEIGPDGYTLWEAQDEIEDNLISAGLGPTTPSQARRAIHLVDRIRRARWRFEVWLNDYMYAEWHAKRKAAE